MNKTGIVINIINKKAGIMTSSGEFLYIKISKVLPNIGGIYTGKLYKKNLFIYKYVISVASLMFMLVSSTYAHSYYTPVSTIILRINPSISIDANKWNKIINSKPLNSDGALILNNIKLKNKSIDVGLGLLVKEAKTENFINEKYISDKKVINLDIKSTKTISIDISNFENTIGNNNLNVKINLSPSNTKNIDIIINNKKINTSTLNNNSYKRKITNNQSNINISENKSSKIKDTLKDNTKSTTKKYNKINNDMKIESKNSTNNSSSSTKHENSNKIRNNAHTSKNKNIKNANLPSNSNIQKHTNKIQNRNSN